MKHSFFAIFLALMLLAVPALATTTGDAFVTVSSNTGSAQVSAEADSEEPVVWAAGSLGDGLLDDVIQPNGELTVDVTTANPEASLLVMPVSMLSDLKEYDNDAPLNAWVKLGNSWILLDQDVMKAIYGAGVIEVAQSKLRSAVNNLASLWDDHDDNAALNDYARQTQGSSVSLDIALEPLVSPRARSTAMNGMPIIGGVSVGLWVGNQEVQSSHPISVRTTFALPQGGSASGVTVVHEENGVQTVIPCTVSGSDVRFDTVKQGQFYVLYDADKAAASKPTDAPSQVPTDPTAPPADPSQVPATGDDSPVGLWLATMLLCGAIALGLRRRKHA